MLTAGSRSTPTSLNTVRTKTECSFREKGSKFIGHLFPAGNEPEFDSHLERVMSRYPDATHHCYAWRLDPWGLKEFAQDDGEPGGTAGLPILNKMKSLEVVNAGLIVVRYYGGTNLGRAGLIEAYSRAAEGCLQKARLHPVRLIWKVEVQYPYTEQNAIESLVHRYSLKELAASYGKAVTRTLACPANHREALRQQLRQLEHRGVTASSLGDDYL